MRPPRCHMGRTDGHCRRCGSASADAFAGTHLCVTDPMPWPGCLSPCWAMATSQACIVRRRTKGSTVSRRRLCRGQIGRAHRPSRAATAPATVAMHRPPPANPHRLRRHQRRFLVSHPASNAEKHAASLPHLAPRPRFEPGPEPKVPPLASTRQHPQSPPRLPGAQYLRLVAPLAVAVDPPVVGADAPRAPRPAMDPLGSRRRHRTGVPGTLRQETRARLEAPGAAAAMAVDPPRW